MTCRLQIHHSLTTRPQRNINQIVILFSLTNQLNLTLNGQTKEANNHIMLINHADIYHINSSQNLVELTIPLFYFYQQHREFFNVYLDPQLLQSSHHIKLHIGELVNIATDINTTYSLHCQPIIDILLAETLVKTNHQYIPHITLNNPIFINCLDYIHENFTQHLSLKDVAMQCNISESYCSNLFVRYLDMNFKDYFTSLKLVTAIQLLLSTSDTVTKIADLAGFNSSTNFSNQFKNYLGFSPKQFRSFITNLKTAPQIDYQYAETHHFNQLFEDIQHTHHEAINQTDIQLEQFEPKDYGQSAKALIRFNTFNELFKFIFNEYYDMNFQYLPKPVIFIDDISDVEISQVNYNLLNRCFEKLFEQDIGLAIAVKSKQQFEIIRQLIMTFLQSNQDYKTSKKRVKFMLVFCSTYMTIDDIYVCHLKIKNKNREIKYSVTVDGFLESDITLEQTYDIMHRLNFHYYFIDIENENTKQQLIAKSHKYHQTDTPFTCYKQFILDSGFPSSKFVYNNLSLHGFKYTNHGQNPLQLSDLVYHLIALLRYGGGVSYQLIDDNSRFISLYNKYGSPLPLVHLYKLIAPFVNEQVQITNNYMMSHKDNNYHVLLFNQINDRYLSDVIQQFNFHNRLSKNSLMVIHTLNKEHGSIQHLLPDTDQLIYIEQDILKQLDTCNHPKTELVTQTVSGKTFEIPLNHDEVKYICFKPH